VEFDREDFGAVAPQRREDTRAGALVDALVWCFLKTCVIHLCMWEMIQSGGFLQGLGIGGAWLITICLLAAGMVGCVVPVLPGHLILLIAVIAYRLMLGVSSGLEWWSFVVLVVLMVISQTFEMLSGAAGSKWFGGTRWGAIGAVIGSLAGFFFFPLGLLLGALLGAFLCEVAFARKQARPAAISGVGSVVGTLTGMVFKVVVGILMLGWFLLDVFVIE
jgi:uncharacterized protein YqgC (DUF456 family)